MRAAQAVFTLRRNWLSSAVRPQWWAVFFVYLTIFTRNQGNPKMTRNEANRYLTAILETVAAVSDTHLGAPEGVMYAALMNDLTLGDFQELLTMCASVGLVTRQNHEVTITAKGRATVAKIVASRVQVIA